LQAHLRAAGVETLVHYPIPIPQQPALATEQPAECPVATRVCREVLSLPLYPSLSEAAVVEVAAALASGPRTAGTATDALNREPGTVNPEPNSRR
jgi:UDP-2-acetamido-2-deoxy-ribo-hexuluronate aminotransferase